MICSKTKLGSELDKIKQLLIENGYPADVLLSCINQKKPTLQQKKRVVQRSARSTWNCPGLVIFHQILKIRSIKPLNLVSMLWSSVWFTVLEIFYHLLKKIAFLPLKKSCVVYEFSCRCEARYVGRTTQRVADRMKQHVPMSIKNKSNTVREQPPRVCKNNNSKINCESAIGQHLLTNPECAKTFTDDIFRIIGQARSSFHLSVLESVYIKTQTKSISRL